MAISGIGRHDQVTARCGDQFHLVSGSRGGCSQVASFGWIVDVRCTPTVRTAAFSQR